MPYGKGTYGSKRGRPSKKAKAAGRKKGMKKRASKKKKNLQIKKRGLYANIHAKRKRIKAGSGERMRKHWKQRRSYCSKF